MVSTPLVRSWLDFSRPSPVAGLHVGRREVATPRAILIAVHGALDRGASFGRLARRLEDATLVTYDRRGYQGSRERQPLGLAQHVEDLLLVASSEDRETPLFLLGHSFGGLVALGAALDSPHLFHGVVTFETPLTWLVARPAPAPDPRHAGASEVEAFFRRMVANEAWDRLSDDERASREADGPALRQDFLDIAGPGVGDLNDLLVPYLYLSGDSERGAYYRSVAEVLDEKYPFIRTDVLTPAPHGIHLSHPGTLAAAVREFIDSTVAEGDSAPKSVH